MACAFQLSACITAASESRRVDGWLVRPQPALIAPNPRGCRQQVRPQQQPSVGGVPEDARELNGWESLLLFTTIVLSPDT